MVNPLCRLSKWPRSKRQSSYARRVTKARDTFALPGGSSFVVRRSAAETNGERVELEIMLPPGAAGPPPHFHPRQEEQWQVLAGALDVQVDANWRTLREGESASVPAG